MSIKFQLLFQILLIQKICLIYNHLSIKKSYEDDQDFEVNVTTKAVFALHSFLSIFSDVPLLKMDQDFYCYDNITQQIFKLFTLSGKGAGELGLEYECSSKLNGANEDNLIYYLTAFRFVDDSDAFNSYYDNGHVYKFLNNFDFYTGLCLYKDCWSIIERVGVKTNKRLFNYLENHLNLIDLKFYNKSSFNFNNPFTNNKNKNNKEQGDNNENSTTKLRYILFNILFYLVIIFFCILILFGIITIYFSYDIPNKALDKSSQENKKITQYLRNDLDDENEDLEELRNSLGKEDDEDSDTYSKHTNKIFKIDNLLDKEGKEKENLTIKDKIKKFILSVNLFKNFKILSEKNNKIYNGTLLGTVSFIKFILLLLMTLNEFINTVIIIPPSDTYNEHFYKSFLFLFIKISSFSFICWIFLDGFTMIFKLLNYVKKGLYEKNDVNVHFKYYLKFFFKTLPQILSFNYYYFLFIFCSKNFQYITFGKYTTLCEYFFDKIDTYNNIDFSLKFLLPFYTFYKSYSDIDNKHYIYSKFTLLLINEFYISFIAYILVYISLKLKKKLFDFIIILIIILNLFFTILTCSFKEGAKVDIKEEGAHHEMYTFSRVINTIEPIRYPHLMLSYYMLGLFTGVSWFYYIDIVSQNSIINIEGAYLPYDLFINLIKFFDSCSKLIKALFYIIFIGLFIMISSTFKMMVTECSYIPTKTGKCNETSRGLYLEFDSSKKFIYFYENFIFIIIFMFFFILFLSSDLHLSNLFLLLIDRSSLAFICLIKTCVHLAYITFHFQFRLSYQCILFCSIGIFALTEIVAWILTITIDIPLKRLYRIISKKKTQSPIDLIDKTFNIKEFESN